MCSRNIHFHFQAFSTRLVAAAWWIFALAVFATYATTLKSFISENFEPSAFHVATDLQELLEKSSFTFAVMAHGSSYALLEGSNAQMHRVAIQWTKKIAKKHVTMALEGFMKRNHVH